MILFINKKVIGVWTFEVSCIKWMEKSVVVRKTLQWKYRLISITSDWYYIISLVIDITFICFLIYIEFTAKNKINRGYLLFLRWIPNIFHRVSWKHQNFHECAARMKSSMFSTHEMKYIWYFILKKVNFLFILYFFRRLTFNKFVNHASSRITIM